MEKVKITNEEKNKKSYSVLSAISGIALIVLFIIDKHMLKLFIGFLLIFYSTYKKDVYISQEGLIYTYDSILFKRKKYFKFKDIEEITILKQKGVWNMFFIQTPDAKKLVVSEERLNFILDIVKKNSSIPVKNISG